MAYENPAYFPGDGGTTTAAGSPANAVNTIPMTGLAQSNGGGGGTKSGQ